MPWAPNSLGTIEYTRDVWNCVLPMSGVPSCHTVGRVSQLYNNVRREGNLVELAYLDSYASRASLRSQPTKRLLPTATHNESDEVLPSDVSLGHVMMTAGFGTDQYFWCNLCGAYTGDRVRKLGKECDRVSRTVHAVTQLRQDRHPVTGTMLNVRARRMLKADVGSNLALLEPFTHAEGADNLMMADHTVGLVQASAVAAARRRQPVAERRRQC